MIVLLKSVIIKDLTLGVYGTFYEIVKFIHVMCGYIEWHAKWACQCFATPNQGSKEPTERTANPVEAGLTKRQEAGLLGLPSVSSQCLVICTQVKQ